MSPKKHKLTVEAAEDFSVLGIVSDEPDYKLCWLINQELGFSLIREDDLELFNRKHNAYQMFSLFSFYDETTMLTHRVISNSGNNGYFIQDLKNLDYLLHIQGEVDEDLIGKLVKSMNNIGGIRLCLKVDHSKSPQRERFQLW